MDMNNNDLTKQLELEFFLSWPAESVSENDSGDDVVNEANGIQTSVTFANYRRHFYDVMIRLLYC
jgi:hypothetical protein